MQKIFRISFLITVILSSTTFFSSFATSIAIPCQKLDIKINNNSKADITVINATTGAHFRLPKNKISNLKMNVGEKLYTLENGKKGTYLLTANTKTATQVQMFNNLIKEKL